MSDRAPWHSINFLTSHDGFTLADLVSYNEKHNWENGEGNTDGHRENLSWNCGEEGPSGRPEVNALRARQQRNFLALLFLSQGVPMLLAGDELGRTQRGNNNAYCQDNEISWLDWSLVSRNADLFRFTQRLIRFRKAHASLRRRSFFEDEARPAVAWHGAKPGKPDWTPESRSLAMQILPAPNDETICVIAHAHWEPKAFELPRLPAGKVLAPLPGHEPATGRRRPRAGSGSAGDLRPQLRGRPALGGGAGGALTGAATHSARDRAHTRERSAGLG